MLITGRRVEHDHCFSFASLRLARASLASGHLSRFTLSAKYASVKNFR